LRDETLEIHKIAALAFIEGRLWQSSTAASKPETAFFGVIATPPGLT